MRSGKIFLKNYENEYQSNLGAYKSARGARGGGIGCTCSFQIMAVLSGQKGYFLPLLGVKMELSDPSTFFS